MDIDKSRQPEHRAMTAPSSSQEQSASARSAFASRLGFLDVLKAVAAQLIVLHHLAFYGPMADRAWPLAPDLFTWLEDEARMAVQLFFVMGGFLAAKALSPGGLPGVDDPLRAILHRFFKLVLPFLVAMALAVAASALARTWMTHDSISGVPTLPQLLAHALLVFSITGHESLSAGAWYVAIDFQLYALLTLLLWLAGRLSQGQPAPWLVPTLIIAAVGASLLYFNRDSAWDVWAPYFFGSYGLGALAWWLSDGSRRPAGAALLMGVMLLLVFAALALDFRSRIAVALATALVLVAASRGGLQFSGKRFAVVGFLGRISYAVFLVHFPVILVVNAAFTRFASMHPVVQAVGVLLAWVASVVAGAAFYRWVEVPLGRLNLPRYVSLEQSAGRPVV